jgi:iron(III) transport system substrate-binding protein
MLHRHLSSSLVRPSRRQILQGVAGAALVAGLGGRQAFAATDPMVWYSGESADAVGDWINAFKEQSGLPADFYRAGSVKLGQKFEQEVKAKQIGCSVISGGLTGLFLKWADEGLLDEYKSPEFSGYAEADLIGNFAAPIKADILCMAYNPSLLKAEDAPKTWEDLLDPKWKGKMVMSDAASSAGALQWYAAVRHTYGKGYMEKLSKQEVLVRTGSGEVVETLISGERPLAAMLLQYHVLKNIAAGANLRVISPEDGVPVGYTYIAVPKGGKTPEAARKFIDYSLGKEAQAVWEDKYFTSSLRTDATPDVGDTGAKPLSQVKRLASSTKDMAAFFGQQTELADEWSTLFK